MIYRFTIVILGVFFSIVIPFIIGSILLMFSMAYRDDTPFVLSSYEDFLDAWINGLRAIIISIPFLMYILLGSS